MAAPLATPMGWDPHANEPLSPSFPFPTPTMRRTDGSNLFLGLDLSTQALKASFTDERLKVVAEFSLRFDEDLPHFGTTSGVHVQGGGVVESPVAMWLEAVDLLFSRIYSTPSGKQLLAQVAAISGAAQQHASVFWANSATSILKNLDSKLPIAKQLEDALSSPVSPNWQDSSTTQECRDMEACIGGAEEMARSTGSRAHERFTGILKLRRTQPALYEKTARISLASSFLTTIFCADGEIKPMEESDACGMNLWGDSGDGLAASALSQKLGPIVQDGSASAGPIGSWWCDRFGMDPTCLVSHFTGDNPATLLSFSLLSGDVIVSLGTSDTILLSTTTYAPSPDSHTFAYPANYPNALGKRSYMAMLCYKNGSLPREAVRDQYAGGAWSQFDRLVEEFPSPKPPSEVSQRELGFWFLKPEIIPHNGYGTHRFNASAGVLTEFKDPLFNCRAILESQFLSFRVRSSKMLTATGGKPHAIYAVGGASSNGTILQALASVMGAPVYRPSTSSSTSCSIGGCMKAFWCWKRAQGKGDLYFEDAVKEAQRGGGGGEGTKVCDPEEGAFGAYAGMVERFTECEEMVCAV
ncbi:hypothetical protein RQP46_009293 [Phenoliferia psychrophenolica]